MTDELSGTGVTPLGGVGTAVWYESSIDLDEPPAAEDVDQDAERAAVEAARERAKEQIAEERRRAAEHVGEEEAEIFDAHLQFLEDPRIVEGIEANVDAGVPATHAVDLAFGDAIEELEAAGGRVAERADDLRDLRDRLLGILTGEERTGPGDLPAGSVLLAERLTPSDTAQLDADRVAGLATIHGGRTSHAAIVARSLAIPAVVGVGEELRAVAAGRTVAVDGEAGTVIVEPDETVRARLEAADTVPVRSEHVTTVDGRAIEVAANLAGPDGISTAVEQGSDGIGLYRTEFLFQGRQSPPDEDEQYDAYVEVLSAFPGERIVVRTLDVGGDKPLPYVDQPDELNPFLGLRGIRRSLGPDADLFETQLRALLRAGAHDDGEGLAVMFPMVATVEEVESTLDVVADVADDLAAADVEHARPELGIMVETPSAVEMAPDLGERVDFFSLGTNDLTQYVMAADRENEGVTALNDPTHPAVLRAIERVVESGHETGCWVGMCGEMAGDPSLTELLVGLGLDELSMSPLTVPAVKARVTETDTGSAERVAERVLAAETREEVRTRLDEATDGE